MNLTKTVILCAMLAGGAIACGGDDDYEDKLPQGSGAKKTFSATIDPGPSDPLAPSDGQQNTGTPAAGRGQPGVKGAPKLQ